MGKNTDENDEKKQEEMLFLRSIHILELYSLSNISCKGFDPLKFAIIIAEVSSPIMLLRLMRLLLANLKVFNPEDWLKPVNNKEISLLGAMITRLSMNQDLVLTEVIPYIVYIFCEVLQLIGIFPFPRDSENAASIEIQGKEYIVNEAAKKTIQTCLVDRSIAQAFSDYLLLWKKQEQAILPDLPDSSKENFRYLEHLDSTKLHELVQNASISNFNEFYCEPLMNFIRACDDWMNNKAICLMFTLFTQRASDNLPLFSSYKCLYTLLKPPCLQLNEVILKALVSIFKKLNYLSSRTVW